MTESLLKYVTKRRNRSSDSSTDVKVDFQAMKNAKSTSDPEITQNDFTLQFLWIPILVTCTGLEGVGVVQVSAVCGEKLVFS